MTPRSFFLWIILAIVTAGLQWRGNAYAAEFGDNSDEAPHYVTGLMVRDYIAQGLSVPPMQFARNYYVHYPKVALGHWPPFYYVVQAAWTLLFTPQRPSLMLLMATLTGLLAALLCEALRGKVMPIFQYGAAILLITLPVIQRFSRIIMAEILVGVLVFLAVIAYQKYLESERWQSACLFGICFALAMLTKGTGVQLAALPLAIVFRGQWHLLRRFSFWLPFVIVAVVAGPWYAFVPGAQHEGVARFGGVGFDTPRLWGTLAAWFQMLGPALSVLRHHWHELVFQKWTLCGGVRQSDRRLPGTDHDRRL